MFRITGDEHPECLPCVGGMFDGIRVDSAGRVWAATHEGVHCFDPDGFITATTSLWSWLTNVRGAQR